MCYIIYGSLPAWDRVVWQVVLPRQLQRDVHGPPTVGHFGASKILQPHTGVFYLIRIAATRTYATGFKAVTFVPQRRDLTKDEEHLCVNAVLGYPCREWQFISWDLYLSPNKETITLWLCLITSQGGQKPTLLILNQESTVVQR